MAAAAPPQAPPLSANQKAANKQFLHQYARANGNMSVQKRLQVIVPALQRLGYTYREAEEIAIDAPLSKDYTNEQAMRAALEYASSIQPNAPNSGINQVLAPNPIPMPAPAASQLAQLQSNQKPFAPLRKGASKTNNRLLKGINSLRRRTDPFFRKVGDQNTPGGIGTLFAINLLFLAAVVPANPQGYTRLELLWLTLMNRTKLDNEIEPPEAPNNALVVAAVGIAEGVQAAAQQIGNAAGAIAGDVNDVGNFFNNIPVIGGIIQAVGLGGGPAAPDAPPATNTGSQPPLTTARPPVQPMRVGPPRPTARQGI